MLSEDMRAYAAKHPKHKRAAELVELADHLDFVDACMPKEPDSQYARKILGAWARARKCWSEVTGEPLVSQAAVETGAKLLTVLGGLRA